MIVRLRAETEADRLTVSGVMLFTNAYTTWQAPAFQASVARLEEACAQASATATNYYWLGVAEFHQGLQMLGLPASTTNRTAANRALDSAVTALKHAAQLDDAQPETHALLATIYGMQIGEHWYRATWLGPRLMHEQHTALAQGAGDPRVRYLLGTSQFYCASRRSGWSEALTNLLSAERIFAGEAEHAPAPLEPRWGRDSCLTYIGLCYEKLHQYSPAEDYFRLALTQHPQNGQAREGLERVSQMKP